tara:strand:+ start:639 stop:857 length:219 start_codon:yes stop_codon:yes gene_type:complete
MKTLYARVSEISGKILINDQQIGTEVKCSNEDFKTIYRFGYVASLNEICFFGDFTIENSVLTLNKSTDESEF